MLAVAFGVGTFEESVLDGVRGTAAHAPSVTSCGLSATPYFPYCYLPNIIFFFFIFIAAAYAIRPPCSAPDRGHRKHEAALAFTLHRGCQPAVAYIQSHAMVKATRIT